MKENEPFGHLAINEGLALTDATCIAQDSTGLIWIGTYAGLQSYDGYSLRRFDYYSQGQNVYKAHNRIRTMVCAGDCLWVGTEGGLVCFGLRIQKYVSYKSGENVSSLDENVISL